MYKQELEVLLTPEVAFDELLRYEAILQHAGMQPGEADFVHLRRRSIDARGRQALVRLRADVYRTAPPADLFGPWFAYPNVKTSKRSILIIGAGPAGLFAALRCIELGLKPIVLERSEERRVGKEC